MHKTKSFGINIPGINNTSSTRRIHFILCFRTKKGRIVPQHSHFIQWIWCGNCLTSLSPLAFWRFTTVLLPFKRFIWLHVLYWDYFNSIISCNLNAKHFWYHDIDAKWITVFFGPWILLRWLCQNNTRKNSNPKISSSLNYMHITILPIKQNLL